MNIVQKSENFFLFLLSKLNFQFFLYKIRFYFLMVINNKFFIIIFNVPYACVYKIKPIGLEKPHKMQVERKKTISTNKQHRFKVKKPIHRHTYRQ